MLSREGHLEAAMHVVAHVGYRYNSRLVYDPRYPVIGHSVLKESDCSEFYRDAKESIPVNSPEPHGKVVDIFIFGDRNHAGDKVSCRSRGVFLINVNTALMQWFSKKQSTVGTEFVAMKKGIDDLRGLKY